MSIPATSLPATSISATSTATTSGPTSTLGSESTVTSEAAPVDQGDILGFALDTVTVGGEPLLVAVADTPELRQRGLMGVVDFGDLHGMLFEFEIPTLGGFWMKDTLVPLDIAFFDADGELVQIMTMTPCVTSDCPSYTPDGPYLWALERPAGTLLGSPNDLTLVR